MPRLFVGIPVPPPCRDALANLAAALGRRTGSAARWTRPENFHLTLQFLGQTPEEQVASVADALAAVRFVPFVLQPGPLRCLPGWQRPRVLHLDLARGAAECAALAESVCTAMDPFGYQRGKAFLPHLTLGRVKRPEGVDWQALAALVPGALPDFTVDRFALWESELTPEGPIYRAVREYPAG